MGLRDLLLLAILVGSVPLIYIKPFFGVLVWYWMSLMNPHLLSWNLASLPLAQVIALAMLSSMLVSREKKRFPVNDIVVLLVLFWLWMLVTTIFAFYPELAWRQWDKVWKIMLTTFAAILVLNRKPRVIALTAVAAGSLALYGIKGGVFTILTGGGYRVWGPAGSFIGGNNEIGLALVVVLPLVWCLGELREDRYSRIGAYVAVFLCFVAILGTQSRGAALGVLAMVGFLGWRSSHRGPFILFAIAMIPIALVMMPESWYDRMSTLSDYQSDASAMGRLRAWEMAFYLALDRPLIGGGFEAFGLATYAIYLPSYGIATDAHSIYFEILGEHGFVGLALFLGLMAATWRHCVRIAKQTKDREDLQWAKLLAESFQVSLFGYAITGAFLGLAYFDLFYCLVALVVGLGVVVQKELSAVEEAVEGVGRLGVEDEGRDQRGDGERKPVRGSFFARGFGWMMSWWRRL